MIDTELPRAPAFEIGAPVGRLADYVRAVWTLDVPGEFAVADEQPVVPDGCPELIFNLGDPIHRVRGDDHDVHLRPQLAGQLTALVTLRPQGRLALVGVRLHPWAMKAFLGVGAREMRDLIVPVESALGRQLTIELQDIDSTGTVRDVSNAIVRTLTRYVATRSVPDASAIMVHRAMHHVAPGGPEATVRSLARELGRSERHVQRVFEESVGLSPKMFLRLARIQRALRMAERSPHTSWSDIAGKCAFYDQSHLIREMQRFAGGSPTQFDTRAGILTRSLVG